MINLSSSNNLLSDIQTNATMDINFVWLGERDYHSIWELQRKIHSEVKAEKMNDVVLLLEHNHVYTLGKNADENHLLPSHPQEADIVQIDRGGDITYHGPGQLVGYPIINLGHYKKSVSWYMRMLEHTIIDFLESMDIMSTQKANLTGVWVEDEKICAMGVRLSRWVTMHGFALNIKPEMKFFDGMIPCGIFDYGVTSIFDCTQKEFSTKDCAWKIKNYFIKNLQPQRVEKEIA